MNVKSIAIITTMVLLATSKLGVAEGLYGGAGLGVVQIEDYGSGYAVSDFPLGSRIFLGFEAKQTLAFEGSFFTSETASQSDGLRETRADFNAFAIYGVGLAPPGDHGQLIVKLGLFTANRKITSAAQTFDDRTSGITLGMGYILDLTERFSIRGDFDWFGSDFEALASGTIGLQFRFGN